MSEVIVEDIADLAVVSRTTVYNYFKNKDERKEVMEWLAEAQWIVP